MADGRAGAPAAAFAFVLSLLMLGAAPMRALPLAHDFTLHDQNGHAFTLSHYRGRPIVLFFGYTHCPDECPTILANLRRAREQVGAPARDAVVALVTVDPVRDRAPELGAFVAAFDPSFLGLTGSAAELARVYRAYHVKIAVQPANGGDYLVAHSTLVYYIGRDGRMRGYGTPEDPPDVLQADLRGIVFPAK